MEQNVVEIKGVAIQELNCITFNASIHNFQDVKGGEGSARGQMSLPPNAPLLFAVFCVCVDVH